MNPVLVLSQLRTLPIKNIVINVIKLIPTCPMSHLNEVKKVTDWKSVTEFIFLIFNT